MSNSGTVLLHFNLPRLTKEVGVVYLHFKEKQDIPKPLRCFKCNRYGHVANTARAKDCGGE